LKKEASQILAQHRPATVGEAERLIGVTPADIAVLTVALARHQRREEMDGVA
jgi:tRNA U34 5-carboxymethylaminomethyl modifying enzyme MnmG/GidA